MKWPSCTCAIWWAAMRATWQTSGWTDSNFPSAPGRCSSFCAPSAPSGTSACSITAITVPTTAACSPVSRCRRQPIPTFCCISATCNTRSRKKPTIRRTSCSWVPNVTAYQALRQPRHETHRVRGLDLHVTRWGRESAPLESPLILLHGWLDVGETFQFIVDAFKKDWPIVAPDWRGFGRSERPQEGYGFPDYLGDFDAL